MRVVGIPAYTLSEDDNERRAVEEPLSEASPWQAPPHCISRIESPFPPGSAAPKLEQSKRTESRKTTRVLRYTFNLVPPDKSKQAYSGANK